jgi:ribokinase
MIPNIVVVGSSNTDMIVQVPRIPQISETVLGGQFSMAPGGKGANQAVAAARAGGSVTFITCVGNDLFGQKAIEGYRQERIDCSYVSTDPEKATGVAFILVGSRGENSIAVASGANLAMTPDVLLGAQSFIASAQILLVQLEIPLPVVRAAVEIAAAAKVKVILNPAPAQPLDDALLHRVSILTPNEIEASLLTGIEVGDDRSIRDAADSLRARGVSTVIITLGARGIYVASTEFIGFIEGFVVHAVDSTAAGDVFNGALAAALTRGMTPPLAYRFANAAAAISVTRLGAQPSAPTFQEINAFLNQY